MSYTIIDNGILDNDDLSIQEQSLLIALKSYFNTEKGYAFPSYTQLKKRSKISDNRTLLKNINSIIEKGYIRKQTVKGLGCKYYILKDSVELHQVENYTKCKSTLAPSGELHEVLSGELHHDLVENYTTTNTNTITNKNTNTTTTISSDSGFNILSYAEDRNFILSAMQIQQIQEDINIYSLEEVKEALTIADNNGKRTYSYVKGILQRRRSEGDKTQKANDAWEEMKKAAANGEEPF